jgi:hypothetical protein
MKPAAKTAAPKHVAASPSPMAKATLNSRIDLDRRICVLPKRQFRKAK